MFLGHFAVAFAAKPAAPKVPLPALVAGAQLADVLWPVFLATGAEVVRIDPGRTPVTPLEFVSYPYSHSLVALALWAVAASWIARRAWGTRAAGLIAALVLSHWVLDVVTHEPDMPLYAGGARFGFGLWYSLPATLVVELTVFVAGLAIYARSTRPVDRMGRVALVVFTLVLVVSYVGNLAGPPPPSVPALVVFAIVGFAILLLLSAWTDRHRPIRRP
jgi:hypothetical protein